MSLIQAITIWTLPVLFAITLHEVAHGWVAKVFGDTTAASLGRLTLNPIKHIDPIGTVLVPALMLILPGNFLFGWAKPVPVSMNQLRNPKRDMTIVAAAGPFANFIMAVFWGLIVKSFIGAANAGNERAEFFVYMGIAGLVINLMLMILNLLPIPPLDGGRVLAGLTPNHFSNTLRKIEPYGFFILIGLLATGVLGKIIFTPFIYILFFILSFFNVGLNEFMPYYEQLFRQSS